MRAPAIPTYNETDFDPKETYLNTDEFMLAFVYDKQLDVEYSMRQGLPHTFINGRLMFPKGLCHRWFAGDRV